MCHHHLWSGRAGYYSRIYLWTWAPATTSFDGGDECHSDIEKGALRSSDRRRSRVLEAIASQVAADPQDKPNRRSEYRSANLPWRGVGRGRGPLTASPTRFRGIATRRLGRTRVARERRQDARDEGFRRARLSGKTWLDFPTMGLYPQVPELQLRDVSPRRLFSITRAPGCGPYAGNAMRCLGMSHGIASHCRVSDVRLN